MRRTMGRSARFIFREFGIRLMASVCLVVTGCGSSQKFRYKRGRTRTKITNEYVLFLESVKAEMLTDFIQIYSSTAIKLSANICNN